MMFALTAKQSGATHSLLVATVPEKKLFNSMQTGLLNSRISWMRWGKSVANDWVAGASPTHVMEIFWHVLRMLPSPNCRCFAFDILIRFYY